MIRRPPRSTLSSSSAASDVYKRQGVAAAHQRQQLPDEHGEADGNGDQGHQHADGEKTSQAEADPGQSADQSAEPGGADGGPNGHGLDFGEFDGKIGGGGWIH